MAIRYISLWTIFDEEGYDRLLELASIIREVVDQRAGIETWDIFGSREQKLVMLQQQFASHQDEVEYEKAVADSGIAPELPTIWKLVYAFSLGELTDEEAKTSLAEMGGFEMSVIQSK